MRQAAAEASFRRTSHHVLNRFAVMSSGTVHLRSSPAANVKRNFSLWLQLNSTPSVHPRGLLSLTATLPVCARIEAGILTGKRVAVAHSAPEFLHERSKTTDVATIAKNVLHQTMRVKIAPD
jgi:hypothetical protein